MSERAPDPRDQAIERSLRRLFTPPEHLPLPPVLERLSTTPRPSAAARGLRLVLAGAAVAAGLAGLLLLVRGQDDGRPEERLARGPQGLRAPEAQEASVAPLVATAPGPIPDGPSDPQTARRPSAPLGASDPSPPSPDASPGSSPGPALLERLYADATRGRAAMAVCSAPDELDVLRRGLAERCGQELFLRPEAAGVLQGPFGSAEWPGGTVVTGFPEGPGGAPAVVLAECEGFGLAPFASASETGGIGTGAGESGAGVALRTFVARVGDVVLTEITPLEEPRLLAYFDPR